MRALLFAAVLGLAGAAHAQQPAAPACAGPAYRQLDFWVGDWDLASGGTSQGTNHITRNEFGDCVIAEHFTGTGGYTGASWSIYDAQTGQWRQTWVDSQGAVFVLTGGPTPGQPHAFELKTTEPRGPDKAIKRMIWQDVAQDRLTWRWQTLQPDGGWKDLWVLNYKRRPASEHDG